MALLGGDSTLTTVTLLLASFFLPNSLGSAMRIVRHLAVEVADGPVEAARIAEKYGLLNLGQVREIVHKLYIIFIMPLLHRLVK